MRSVLLLFEPPDGGVAEHVHEVAISAASHGWVATVAGPATSTIRTRLEEQGIEYIAIAGLRRGYGNPLRDLEALRSLFRLLRTGRFDVVHSHSAKAGVLGRLAALAARTPRVYNPHCFGFVGDVSRGRRAFTVSVEWLLGRSTTTLICGSDAEVGRAQQFRIADGSRLRRIYLGTPELDAGIQPSAELVAFRGDGVLVGALAVMRAQKRLDLLIDVAPDLLARFPEARIAIIGNGPLEPELRERARSLGLDAHDRFAIFPFSPPAGRYLQTLDVFVLPSSWEGMPVGVLEALAYGVPQVATDVEGTGEAVAPDTGILIPPRDREALSDAIASYLSSPARRIAASRASVARHEAMFTVDRMAREMSEVYAEALEAHELRRAA